jgi:hypothetical protein
MPSFCILANRVVRFRPRRAAATWDPLITAQKSQNQVLQSYIVADSFEKRDHRAEAR